MEDGGAELVDGAQFFQSHRAILIHTAQIPIHRWTKHAMQKQRLQVFPKDDGKLTNVQKKGLSILLWVKRERRYTTAVTVRPEAEKTWTGDAASDNWDRILDFGGHCDAAASCAAADNVILSFANLSLIHI